MDDGGSAIGGIIGLIFGLGILVLIVASGWKIFVKAGKPGWAAIIPIYNIIVALEIGEKPIWWVILCFIPLVQYVAFVLIAIGVAEKFGKGAGFGVGLGLLFPIFGPLLAFTDAQYQG